MADVSAPLVLLTAAVHPWRRGYEEFTLAKILVDDTCTPPPAGTSAPGMSQNHWSGCRWQQSKWKTRSENLELGRPAKAISGVAMTPKVATGIESRIAAKPSLVDL